LESWRSNMAERVGFEPTVRLHVRLISSQVHSTTLPPLRWAANDTDRRGRPQAPAAPVVARPPGRDDCVDPDRPLLPLPLGRMIEFGHLTHVGLRRELNEDTYYGDSELGLWLVADGMGGHEYGEVASALAREAIVREVRRGAPLEQAIRTADEDIIHASQQRGDALPMGTTVVAARIAGRRFEVAWVGDSRVYLWRDGKLAQ